MDWNIISLFSSSPLLSQALKKKITPPPARDVLSVAGQHHLFPFSSLFAHLFPYICGVDMSDPCGRRGVERWVTVVRSSVSCSKPWCLFAFNEDCSFTAVGACSVHPWLCGGGSAESFACVAQECRRFLCRLWQLVLPLSRYSSFVSSPHCFESGYLSGQCT
ncbi:hypothetical protein F2Q70_00000653 [Brassica cretica]|uniref:Uncharacterized protein n=1 Tax=Brassica cretica TaxID=69181 RepID=A0A8S9ILD9_BRACR|nr:hypothetical protein F2Q70_00000653 [Brassica cretica]KAF3568575.1 hypothetical protein DY000_02011690 [Brassica cretica]